MFNPTSKCMTKCRIWTISREASLARKWRKISYLQIQGVLIILETILRDPRFTLWTTMYQGQKSWKRWIFWKETLKKSRLIQSTNVWTISLMMSTIRRRILWTMIQNKWARKRYNSETILSKTKVSLTLILNILKPHFFRT